MENKRKNARKLFRKIAGKIRFEEALVEAQNDADLSAGSCDVKLMCYYRKPLGM
jgi:hypothetical protein